LLMELNPKLPLSNLLIASTPISAVGEQD